VQRSNDTKISSLARGRPDFEAVIALFYTQSRLIEELGGRARPAFATRLGQSDFAEHGTEKNSVSGTTGSRVARRSTSMACSFVR
jgi:hypothetical protein